MKDILNGFLVVLIFIVLVAFVGVQCTGGDKGEVTDYIVESLIVRT